MYDISELIQRYEKGITLKSGVKLSPEDIYELNRISRIIRGMDSYFYTSENVDYTDIENWPELEDLDTEIFEDIYFETSDHITGDDEFEAVLTVLRRKEFI